MSRVDVSDIILDSDFVGEMKIVRREARTNSRGENVNTEVCVDTFGTIQPASGKAVQRLPEALRNANYRSFWVQGKITEASEGRYTDILVFEGERYQVTLVMDWSAWGGGWSEGLCVAEKITT